MKICSVGRCSSEVHAKNLCEMHYRRLRRTKTVGSSGRLRPGYRESKEVDVYRFFKKVRKTESCWLWIGGKTTSGYGEFQVEKKTRYVHRWVYEFFKEKIPKDLHIDHLCNVRNCVNPDHLEAVTIQENSRREAKRIKDAKAT